MNVFSTVGVSIPYITTVLTTEQPMDKSDTLAEWSRILATHEFFAITTFAFGTFATRSMFIYQKCLVPVSSKQSSHSFSLGRFFELHMPFLFPVTKTNQYLIRFPKYLLELLKHLLFALLCVPIARQKRQRQTNK